MQTAAEVQSVIDCRDAAEMAGLIYASPDELGIARRRAGRGFTYRGPDGEPIVDAPDP